MQFSVIKEVSARVPCRDGRLEDRSQLRNSFGTSAMEMTALTGQRLSPPQLRQSAAGASRSSELKRRSSVSVRAQGAVWHVNVESTGSCVCLLELRFTKWAMS